MKKLFILFFVIFFIPTIIFAYETEPNLYSVNAINYTKDGIVYNDTIYIDSNITVVTNPYGESTNSVTYEDIYNQDNLRESNQVFLNTYTDLFANSRSNSFPCFFLHHRFK